jgi:hypothetical protein
LRKPLSDFPIASFDISAPDHQQIWMPALEFRSRVNQARHAD